MQNRDHSFAILGTEPSIQILWSTPPVANLGAPTLSAVQLLLFKRGGMLSQTAPVPGFKAVTSHSLKIQNTQQMKITFILAP